MPLKDSWKCKAYVFTLKCLNIHREQRNFIVTTKVDQVLVGSYFS